MSDGIIKDFLDEATGRMSSCGPQVSVHAVDVNG